MKSIEHLGYIFNEDGTVFNKSINRFVSGNHGKNWYRKLFIDGKRIYIHRIIAGLFIPNPENKPEVNHKNGIKTDNRVDNLEWVTRSENIRHAHDTGLTNPTSCENHPKSRLSNIQVLVIREAISMGHKQNAIAKYFRIRTSTISRINTGKQWRIQV